MMVHFADDDLPPVDDFGAWLRDARERAGLSLDDIATTTKVGRGQLAALERNDLSRWPAGIFRRACVSAEFRAFGGGGSSPVTLWLRALARLVHAECGGPGVGAIGMCFTGNFALTMMLEPAMLAPVLSQPSLPLDEPAGLEISREDLEAVAERLEREDLTVLAYRFEGDAFCRAERFAAYAEALGPRFEARVLPDAAANPGPRPPFFEQFVTTPSGTRPASSARKSATSSQGRSSSQRSDRDCAWLAERPVSSAASRTSIS